MIEALGFDPELVKAGGKDALEAAFGVAAYRHLDRDQKRQVLERVQDLNKQGHGKLAFKLRATVGESIVQPRWVPASMLDGEIREAMKSNEWMLKSMDVLAAVAGRASTPGGVFFQIWAQGLKGENNALEQELRRRRPR